MHHIPAIEYKEIKFFANGTIGNDFINVISGNISGVVPGMVLYGPGLVKITVLSVLGNQITIDHVLTASFAGQECNIYNRFDFRYPAEKGSDNGEINKVNAQVSRSLTGHEQKVLNYVEAIRDMSFSFLTKAEKDFLTNDIFLNELVKGKSIRFFEDKDFPEFETYTSSASELGTQRQFPHGNDFLYRVSFSFRRLK